MEFEYWWLLGFPLFFGLGWMAARIDIKQIVSESRALPRSYFKGLNFLLNEQPDKAIEAFIEVVKVDPETVELHFALGSLFRRRGEYDRAIRMHQNLLDRADLGGDQKLQAQVELGQDYLKAGILDRAEEVFSRLEKTNQSMVARRHLLEIYEQEKDWPRAIEMTKQVETDPRALAQYLCELAQSEAAQSRPDTARRHLDAALEANRKCVRASLLWGDLERNSNQLERAIEHWKRIESQNPAYLALVAERLVEAYRDAGRAEEGLTLLAGYLERYPSLDLLDTVFQQTLEAKGADRAYEIVRDELSAIRRCSASITCSRRRSSPRARPTSAETWSWCATWSMDTPGAWRATAARAAASRRANSTGNARPAAAGKPIHPAAPRNST